ncbi:MAG: class putative F420-dependent enzyme [Conexibacter sp.]|nr:class putative F420-dependent enzyme [Conexibacter sp.]
MPTTPMPPHVEAFLREPNDAVIATLRHDGAPAAIPCWYRYESGTILLSIFSHAQRLRNLRADARVSLTAMAKAPYRNVSLGGVAVELRDDPELRDIDALSQHYEGAPHHDRTHVMTTAVVVVQRWYAYGLDLNPPGSSTTP